MSSARYFNSQLQGTAVSRARTRVMSSEVLFLPFLGRSIVFYFIFALPDPTSLYVNGNTGSVANVHVRKVSVLK